MTIWKVSDASETQRALEALGATPVEAAELIARYGSLHAMLAEGDALQARPDLRRGILAARQVAVAWASEELAHAATIHGAEEAIQFLRPRLADRQNEVFAVIFLNQKNDVLAYRELFHGSVAESRIHPREIIRAALKENAAAVILAHNHPSGHASPSPDDLSITKRLTALLAEVDVRVLDHVIVGGAGCFSFAKEGLL